MGQLGFLKVRLNPMVPALDDAENGFTVLDPLTRLQLHTADNPVGWRRYRRIAQHQFGLVALGFGLEIIGVLLDRCKRIAAEIGHDTPDLLAQRPDGLSRGREPIFSLIEPHSRRDTALLELLLTFILPLQEFLALQHLIDFRFDLGIFGALGLNFVAHREHSGFGPVDRDMKRLRVDLKEDVARVDGLIVFDFYVDHASRDVRCDRDHVRLDVGVLRRDIAAAKGVPIEAADRCRYRHDQQKHKADETASPLSSWLLVSHYVLNRLPVVSAACRRHPLASSIHDSPICHS